MLKNIWVSVYLFITISSYGQSYTIIDQYDSPDGDSTSWLLQLEDSSLSLLKEPKPVLDTLVIYDVTTQEETFLPIIESEEDQLINDYIIGSSGEGTEIELPSLELGDSSLLTKVTATNGFDLESYPIRANVALLRVTELSPNGRSICSGTLIGPNMVLTSAHCIGKPDSLGDFYWNNLHQVSVAPSYSDGDINSNYGKVKVVGAFIPKYHYDNYQTVETFNNYDMGVVLLEENIGNVTGWMGMKYSEDKDSLYSDISYNYSYPGQKGYDGKEMYFSYDKVEPAIFFGFKDNIEHIVGQSGSSYFLIKDEEATIFGITYTETIQLPILQNFCRGVNKIQSQNEVLSLHKNQLTREVDIFPNPVIDAFEIELEGTINKVDIIDSEGVISLLQKSILGYDISTFSSGVYVLRIETNKGVFFTRFVK